MVAQLKEQNNTDPDIKKPFLCTAEQVGVVFNLARSPMGEHFVKQSPAMVYDFVLIRMYLFVDQYECALYNSLGTLK